MRVMISLPEDMVEIVKQEANKRGATFSGLIRRALIKEVEELEDYYD